MTVNDWIQSAKTRLEAVGLDSASLESQLLAGHVLGVGRPWLMSHSEEDFPEDAGEIQLIRRLRHEPLAYILGYREFYGRRFLVNPDVLIPRHETETVVEAALELARASATPNPKVLDLGTGSGCIAISLKLENPDLDLTGSDLSSGSLEVAQENALALDASIRFVRSNRFDNLKGDRFDILVSNPPYIGDSEVLPREVSDFEPRVALYSGPTGYEFYEQIACEALDYLNQNGSIVLEVGHQQAQFVERIFLGKGWTHFETRRDLSGIPRTVVFKHVKSSLEDS